MIKRLPWFERVFPIGMPAHLLQVIIERLRGTPARLVDRLVDVPQQVLTQKDGNSWSIQENVGHLLDMEPLWQKRIGDLVRRQGELSEADLTNSRTHQANHNAKTLTELLTGFRSARLELVGQLEKFPHEGVEFVSLHPRLKTPMNVVDVAYFVAEHDDYHLARIGELLGAANGLQRLTPLPS